MRIPTYHTIFDPKTLNKRLKYKYNSFEKEILNSFRNLNLTLFGIFKHCYIFINFFSIIVLVYIFYLYSGIFLINIAYNSKLGKDPFRARNM